MSSRKKDKPGRVMERADRNSHTGVAIFLAHADKDDPRQQLLPEDRSELLEQADNVNTLMNHSHKVYDGRLGWLKSYVPSGRRSIDRYDEAASDYSLESSVSSQKTNLGENERIDARAPWSPTNLGSKASKERHAYIKPKMEQVLSCPDAFQVGPLPPRPPPGNPPSTRTGIPPGNIDAHRHPPSTPPSTILGANDLTPRESLSESNYGGAPVMWRRRSGSTPGTSSYNSTSSDDDDDESPQPSRPAPVQSANDPPAKSRPLNAQRGQLRVMNPSSHITSSETTTSETRHSSLPATESYHSMPSHSTTATLATSSPRSRLSSSAANHSSRTSQLTMATVATSVPDGYTPNARINSMEESHHSMSSHSTAATVATSSPHIRLSSSAVNSSSRTSQLTMATVATSVPEGYPADTPMNSIEATRGVSSHLSAQAPMPSSYHAATVARSSAGHNPHSQTTGGHPPSIPAHRNVRSSRGGGMPATQAPPPILAGQQGHPSTASYRPHASTNSATAVFVPLHPTGAYHSAPAAQRPARSSQDSTSTNSAGHWSTTANFGS